MSDHLVQRPICLREMLSKTAQTVPGGVRTLTGGTYDQLLPVGGWGFGPKTT